MDARACARDRGWASAAWNSTTLPVTLGLAAFVAISQVEVAIEAAASSLALSAILLTVAGLVGLLRSARPSRPNRALT